LLRDIAMKDLHHILCPVDFSEASAHAVDQAIAIASWYGARITALHVRSPMVLPIPGVPVGELPTLPVPDEEAHLQIEERVRALFSAGRHLRVDVQIETGLPATVILDSAAGRRVDLVAMGTHGTGGFARFVLGSVAEKVLRKAACPVLTVPPRAHTSAQLPFKRLLCAVDFSAPSLLGLQFALSLARESDAHLTLLHVITWPWQEPPGPALEALPPEMAFHLTEYRRHCEQDASGRLAALVPADARTWCTPTTQVRHGRPHAETLRLAAEESADLIVIGVSGRNTVDLHLLGSTANQVVRSAVCPVLTVRS
jgi:nucleotide-binding universal stress UspA family protein